MQTHCTGCTTAARSLLRNCPCNSSFSLSIRRSLCSAQPTECSASHKKLWRSHPGPEGLQSLAVCVQRFSHHTFDAEAPPVAELPAQWPRHPVLAFLPLCCCWLWLALPMVSSSLNLILSAIGFEEAVAIQPAAGGGKGRLGLGTSGHAFACKLGALQALGSIICCMHARKHIMRHSCALLLSESA